MTRNMFRDFFFVATLPIALSMSGCGGGGSVSEGMDTGGMDTGETTTEPPAQALTVPGGMTISSSPRKYARDADDTIAMLLPDPSNRFAPVSARSRRDEFHVNTIRSDGNNGFHVTYVLGGREQTVHFEAAKTTERPTFQYEYYAQTENGARFWLNSSFGSFSAKKNKNQGSPYFEYLEILGAGGKPTRRPQPATPDFRRTNRRQPVCPLERRAIPDL